MLTDIELKSLRSQAKKKGLPVSTVAYEYIARSL